MKGLIGLRGLKDLKGLKKGFAFVLAVSLCGSLLAGCTKETKQEGKATTAPQATASAGQTSEGPAKAADPNDEIVAGFKELHLTVLGKVPSGNKVPTEDVLTPIWREKTKVIPEIIAIPGGQDMTNWLQLQITANTMPDIIAVTNGIFDAGERYQMLKKSGELREIKLDDLKHYMPRMADKLGKYNLTMEDWYNANVDATDGKLWVVPAAPKQVLRPDVKGTRYFESNTGRLPYNVWLRDDILKQIFPEVKTEEELKALYIQKEGKLTPEEVLDIPIKNADQLLDYVRKVKDLNLKVGNKEIIPILPVSNGADQGSYMWSNFSFPGLWWDALGDRIFNNKTGDFNYFAATPEWKDWLKWLNTANSEGLLGQDFFLLKEDQRNARIINGEYAVFQEWGPEADAKKKSLEENRGYGFRLLTTFMNPLQTKYQDMTDEQIEIRNYWGALSLGKSVKDADIPQILHWIDWNYSEQAAELRAWGTPDMYTGDKEERRFKPEYKELEDWAVRGVSGEKDGTYYGLFGTNIDVAWNHETYGIGFGDDAFKSPWAPVYVYPLGADTFDSGMVTKKAVRDTYRKDQTFTAVKALSPEAMAAKAEFDQLEAEFNKLKGVVSYDSDGSKLATVKMIIGKPEEFEGIYENWYKKFITDELLDNIKKQGEAYANYLQAREASLSPVE